MNIRDMETEFGVLPIPKYDEQQDGYHSLIGSWGGNAFAIPRVLEKDEAQFAASVKRRNNYQRLNVITLEKNVTCDKIILICLSTHGCPNATVFGLDAYE